MLHRRETSRLGQGGFTLLEIMIAFTILSIGVLSIGVGQLSAMRMTSGSKNMQEAMFLAEEQMEIFRALPWSAPAPWGPVFFQVACNDCTDATNQALPGNPHAALDPANQDALTYRRTWTIRPGQPPFGLTEIEVEVSWTGAHGQHLRANLVSWKGPQ